MLPPPPLPFKPAHTRGKPMTSGKPQPIARSGTPASAARVAASAARTALDLVLAKQKVAEQGGAAAVAERTGLAGDVSDEEVPLRAC